MRKLFLWMLMPNSSNYSKDSSSTLPLYLLPNPRLSFHLRMVPMLRNPSSLSATLQSSPENFPSNWLVSLPTKSLSQPTLPAQLIALQEELSKKLPKNISTAISTTLASTQMVSPRSKISWTASIQTLWWTNVVPWNLSLTSPFHPSWQAKSCSPKLIASLTTWEIWTLRNFLSWKW